MDPDSEFVFELQVCQWAERFWPPGRPRSDPIVVARQLGTKRRRWDTIVIEADLDALRERARFGRERLDSDLLDVLRYAPEEWGWYRDALPDPGYPWRYVRESIHRAADRDILETRTQGNRLQIRRRWVYPDWVNRIVAIENKPDLDASAARALTDQLQRDVAVGLADEVWVATAGGHEQFERALFEDIPVEAGIVLVDEADADVLWQPRSLSPDEPGTRIEQRPDGGDRDASAARFSYVDPDWKRAKRLAIAERAYERGFRSYAETMRPERLTLEQTNPQTGQQVQVTQTFTDFRTVSGVRLPFTTETVQSTGDGENTVTATIQSLDINADLEDGLFTLGSSSGGGASQ